MINCIQKPVWTGREKLVALGLQHLLLLSSALLILVSPVGQRVFWRTGIPCLRTQLGCYALLSLLLVLTVFPGIDLPDEGVYLFQSRALAKGHLTTYGPPLEIAGNADLAKAFSFDHHVIHKDRWFGKYPPGWPLLLSLGLLSRLSSLVNPLAGLAALALTFCVARHLFGEATARLSVVLLIASPYFVMNFLGFMSHPPAAVLILLSTFLVCTGVERASNRRIYAAILVLMLAFWVRPFTVVCVGIAFAGYGWIRLKGDKGRRARVAVAAMCAAVVLLGSLLWYNFSLCGNMWLSPYALSRGTSVPVELRVSATSIWLNLRSITLPSLGDTLMAAFCFIFLLAGYGLLKERRNRPETWFLASLFLCLVVGHLVQTETSTSYIGERYYVEGFFAIAVLAARGWEHLRTAWAPSRATVSHLALLLAATQIVHFAIFARNVYESRHAYASVQEAVDTLALHHSIVFMKAGSRLFFPQRFNVNEADWMTAPVIYLRDPGPAFRPAIARILKRDYWVVGYSDRDKKPVLETGTTLLPETRSLGLAPTL